MALQALRDELVYYYGYSQGRGFSISDLLSRTSAKVLSQVTSLMTIPLPLLSFLAVPFFGSSSTTISLAFFLLTWVTLVSTHDPLYLELVGTLAIKIIFFLLPSLAVLGFDSLIPSLSASIKSRGVVQLPTQLSSRMLRNVIFVSLFNVAFSVLVQGICDYVLTEVLNVRSAIRVSKIPPAPWPTMVKEVLYGLTCRGVLHYFIHRDVLHASPRDSVLARWHADWAHSLRHPFSLASAYDHPVCHLLIDWAPLYLSTLFFRFHVLTWYILTAIISLEQFFIFSGYSVLPSQILLAGMAKRTDSHYATGGKGNYGNWGVLDWIFGTGCPGDADVVDDVQGEVDKRAVKQRASNMIGTAEESLRKGNNSVRTFNRDCVGPEADVFAGTKIYVPRPEKKQKTGSMKFIDAAMRVIMNSRLPETPCGDANSLYFCSSHSGKTQWFQTCLTPLSQTGLEQQATQINLTPSISISSISTHPSISSLQETHIMQEPQQPSPNILTTAYNFLIRGKRFFANLCARRSQKKRQTYDWEERLAYVGEEVEVEDDETSSDEHDMQLERSWGVARYRD